MGSDTIGRLHRDDLSADPEPGPGPALSIGVFRGSGPGVGLAMLDAAESLTGLIHLIEAAARAVPPSARV
jgi:hypothetical protein